MKVDPKVMLPLIHLVHTLDWCMLAGSDPDHLDHLIWFAIGPEEDMRRLARLVKPTPTMIFRPGHEAEPA